MTPRHNTHTPNPADQRVLLGDRVLTSIVVDFAYAFGTFAARVVRGTPVGPAVLQVGIGTGLGTAPLSPFVPVAGQQAIADLTARLAAANGAVAAADLASPADVSLARQDVVFCGVLVDAENVTRHDPSAPGAAPCLLRADVASMAWLLPGVILRGTALAPVTFVVPWRMPAALFWIVIVSALATAFAAAVVIAVVHVRRRTRSLRAAAPALLIIMACGCLVVAAELVYDVLTYAQAPPPERCGVGVVLCGIGFALFYGALIAKQYRVHRIFNNRTLHRVELGDVTMIAMALGIAVAQGIFLAVVSALAPRAPHAIFIPVGTAGGGYTVQRCIAASPIAADALMHFSGVLALAYGAVLAHRTRAVTPLYSESRHIAMWCVFTRQRGTVSESRGHAVCRRRSQTLPCLRYPPFRSITVIILCELSGFVLTFADDAASFQLPSVYWIAVLTRMGVIPMGECRPDGPPGGCLPNRRRRIVVRAAAPGCRALPRAPALPSTCSMSRHRIRPQARVRLVWRRAEQRPLRGFRRSDGRGGACACGRRSPPNTTYDHRHCLRVRAHWWHARAQPRACAAAGCGGWRRGPAGRPPRHRPPASTRRAAQ